MITDMITHISFVHFTFANILVAVSVVLCSNYELGGVTILYVKLMK